MWGNSAHGSRGSQQGRGNGAPAAGRPAPSLPLTCLSQHEEERDPGKELRSPGGLPEDAGAKEAGAPPRFSIGLLSDQGAKLEGPGSPPLALRALPTPPGKRLIQSEAEHLTPALTLNKARSHCSLGSPLGHLSCSPFLTHRTGPRQQGLQRTTMHSIGRSREPLGLHPAQRT